MAFQIETVPLKVRVKVMVALVSVSTIAGIALTEGWRDTAYIPVPGDVPTIAHGHTKGVKMGDKVTRERGLQMLEEDVNYHANGIRQCIAVPVSKGEWGSFVSLSFSIGVTAFCRKGKVDANGVFRPNLIDLINATRYAEACKRIEAFKYGPGHKVLPGLVKRRAAERKVCESD